MPPPATITMQDLLDKGANLDTPIYIDSVSTSGLHCLDFDDITFDGETLELSVYV